MSELLHAIHTQNPYENFPISDWKPDLQGWSEDSPIFEQVIKVKRPATIVEVGTWKGASAIRMATLLKQNGLPASRIVCVDTWLGSAEHWINRNDDPSFRMPMRWGHPTIYEQFLANVIHAGQADMIVPLPVDSLTGAQLLLAKKLFADAIYIDASHDYDHVLADLKAYWDVLKPGGIFFGDDYHLFWIGVVRAVHDFAGIINRPVNAGFQNKWLIQKP
jgi:predicted O-methyltransferase YrrM